MNRLSTHILDTANGRPVAGINVQLLMENRLVGSGATDHDGRIPNLLTAGQTLTPGTYSLVFEIGDYFPEGFYPEVNITFAVRDDAHYHVPLLISPFGYTTYRGS